MVQLDSEAVENAQTLIQGLFSIKLPTIRILVSEPIITFTAAAISATAATVSCETINAELGQDASSFSSDLNFDFKSLKVEMGLIECLFVAGVLVP